ncbi:MAG: ATP-binding protein [Clostridiales bacterium]|nr:ATP-binding protein [Clostridiales bacterium]
MFADRDTDRLRKQAERDRRIQAIYQQSPQLKQFDDALSAAGREAILRVWEGGNVDAAKERISALQTERERLLSTLGVDENAYEVAWDCPQCQDRGYLYPGVPCECQRRDDGLRRRAESGLTALQKNQCFENFSLQWYDQPREVEKLVEKMESFAGDLIEGKACGNLFLYGSVGNGKTHLCSAVANRVLEKGKTLLYIRTEELLEALREDIYGSREYSGKWEYLNYEDKGDKAPRQESLPYGRSHLQNQLIRTDLLILEDLGTERLTDFAEEQLTNLIDQRINWQKPWIITSHLVGDAFTNRYDPRLVDRVLGESKRLYLNEKSIRFKRAQMRERDQR